MRTLCITLPVLLALAGCAGAAERPSVQALVAQEQWVEACQRIDRVGERASDVRARRDATRRVGGPYRTTVELAPETLERANAALGFDLLHGELASLRVSALSRGPHVESTHIVVTAREDGTLWRSLGTHREDSDLLARLFGSKAPALLEAPPHTPVLSPRELDAQDALKRFEVAVERCQPDANPCEQWFPLARAAPSLGPEVLVLDLDLWLEDGTQRCLLETRRHVPLPEGATLHERLVALAARGPIEVRWGE